MNLAGETQNKPKWTITLSRMQTGVTFKLSRMQTQSQYLFDRFMGNLRLKMVCLDLDGTALNYAQKIVPGNLEAIKQLKEKRTEPMVNIVTGRGFHQAKRFAEEMQAKYFVTDNGGAIFEKKDSEYKLVKASTMPEAQSRDIFNEIHKYAQENISVVFHLSTPDKFFIEKDSFDKAYEIFYPGEPFGDGVEEFESFDEISKRGLSNEIIKICVDFGEGAFAKKQCKAFKEYLEKNKINYFRTADTMFEMAPDDVNKGKAIQDIMKREKEGRSEMKRYWLSVILPMIYQCLSSVFKVLHRQIQNQVYLNM